MSWNRRGLLIAVFTLVSVPAFAQLNGENLLGDNGVKSGTQADPGVYLGFLYYHYDSDTIKSKDGTVLTLMRSFETSGGATVYFDQKKTISAARRPSGKCTQRRRALAMSASVPSR